MVSPSAIVYEVIGRLWVSLCRLMPPGNQVKAKTAIWSGVLLRMEKARRGWSSSRGAMMMVLKGCSGEAGVLSGLLLKKVCGWSRCWDLGCVRVLCRSLVSDWA